MRVLLIHGVLAALLVGGAAFWALYTVGAARLRQQAARARHGRALRRAAFRRAFGNRDEAGLQGRTLYPAP